MFENIYRETTQEIEVEVIPLFVPEQTQFVGQFLYTYNVSITNNSNHPCQLLRRKWIIVDGNGHSETVEGDGVVGEQPQIQPGATYQYSSYCPLSSETGNMRGSFYFIDDRGEEFEVKVPLFFLRKDAIIQ